MKEQERVQEKNKKAVPRDGIMCRGKLINVSAAVPGTGTLTHICGLWRVSRVAW